MNLASCLLQAGGGLIGLIAVNEAATAEGNMTAESAANIKGREKKSRVERFK